MTVAKPQVLFIGNLDKSLPQYKAFQQQYECINYSITTKEQVITDFAQKFQNVEAIYGAWLGFFTVGGFRGELLEAAPKTLKCISICSVGFDGYDGPAMASKDIVLTNVPSDGAAVPVADLVLYKALSSFRNFRVFEEAYHSCNHTIVARSKLDSTEFDSPSGKPDSQKEIGYAFGEQMGGRPILSPQGHNAVIVGFGNIGQTIGKRLADIGMNVHYVKRSKLSEAEEAALPYKATYHKDILETKDFVDLVVIACPATPETKHLINKNVIDLIAKPFRVINIGRGLVIDENALVDGLKSGKVLFAGLDVFEKEPACHPELIGRQDVILTPHIGASTKENFDHTAIVAMENIGAVLSGKAAITRVN